MATIPTRLVETEWGALYADATGDGTVRFSTESVNPTDPDRHLTINGRPYFCHVELSQSEPKVGGRLYVDDIWHLSAYEAIQHLRRHPSGTPAPITAHIALQREVAPKLTQWLYDPEGVALLEDGSNYPLAQRVMEHDSAQQTLQDALERAHRLQAPIRAGLSVDPADEGFLRYITTEFTRAASLGTTPETPDRPAPPATTAPQPTPRPEARGL